MPKERRVVLFNIDERRTAFIEGQPNLELIQAIIGTAQSGKAIKIDRPDGIAWDKFRSWFSGSPLRYIERRGLTLRQRGNRAKTCVWVWAQTARRGYRDALDEAAG